MSLFLSAEALTFRQALVVALSFKVKIFAPPEKCSAIRTNNAMEPERTSSDGKFYAGDKRTWIFFDIFNRKGDITHHSYLIVVGLDHPNST